MQVQVNAHSSIASRDATERWAQSELEGALGAWRAELTRIEVHLSDENSQKAGAADKRCRMEARPAGKAPVVVSHDADSIDQAFRGATGKLRNALEHALGNQRDHRERASIRRDEGLGAIA